MNTLFSACLALLLLWAVFSDVFYRRIPNITVLAILVLALARYLLLAFDSGVTSALSTQLLPALAGAAAILVVGYLIFLAGRMGAGDVKLMAVTALWLGYEQQLLFLVCTSLCGGFLALALPIIEHAERRVAAPVFWLAGRFPHCLNTPTTFDQNRPQGIPYGIAIAAGAMICLI